MTESKRKRLLFGVFVVAIIFGLVMKPWEPRRAHPPAESESPPVEAAAQAEAVAATGTADNTALRVRIRLATAWPKDPFGPHTTATPVTIPAPTAPAVVEEPPRLQGIMHVGGRDVCVIGRQTFGVGETVDGWRITAIKKDNVLLTRGARRLRLALP